MSRRDNDQTTVNLLILNEKIPVEGLDPEHIVEKYRERGEEIYNLLTSEALSHGQLAELATYSNQVALKIYYASTPKSMRKYGNNEKLFDQYSAVHSPDSLEEVLICTRARLSTNEPKEDIWEDFQKDINKIDNIRFDDKNIVSLINLLNYVVSPECITPSKGHPLYPHPHNFFYHHKKILQAILTVITVNEGEPNKRRGSILLSLLYRENLTEDQVNSLVQNEINKESVRLYFQTLNLDWVLVVLGCRDSTPMAQFLKQAEVIKSELIEKYVNLIENSLNSEEIGPDKILGDLKRVSMYEDRGAILYRLLTRNLLTDKEAIEKFVRHRDNKYFYINLKEHTLGYIQQLAEKGTETDKENLLTALEEALNAENPSPLGIFFSYEQNTATNLVVKLGDLFNPPDQIHKTNSIKAIKRVRDNLLKDGFGKAKENNDQRHSQTNNIDQNDWVEVDNDEADDQEKATEETGIELRDMALKK